MRIKNDGWEMLTEAEKRHMLLRPEVVAAIREVIEQNPYIPATSQLLNVIRDRIEPKIGISKAEIAKPFYPERFEGNYFRRVS
jgi:hypothetical protein